MKLAMSRLGLPLLAKELVEQAAQKRTYAIRVVYAALLFLAGFAFYYQIAARHTSSPFAVLGQGRELYVMIVMMQFVGIYLFMPAMTCGVVTMEKERNSLGLLFLTRLGPWTILLEKYLARIVPMFSFLILSLPLLVIAYALGGITQQYLWSGIWFLGITVFQVGALSILCSAFFRTTVVAFVTSYLLLIVMLFSFLFLDEIFEVLFRSSATQFIQMMGWDRWLGDAWWISWPFCAPAIFESAQSRPVIQIFVASCPILLMTCGCLGLARWCLVRRAFLAPSNLVLRIFKKLDVFFHELNDNRLTKGIILVKDNTSLPTLMEPVAWRETTKTSLGAFRYLLRLLVVIETPVIVICILLVALQGGLGPLGALVILLWVLSTLIVSVKATSVVAAERSHETLDVLLTSPLTSTEIIQQKFRGVQRLMVMLSVPLLTTIFIKTWFVATVGTGFGYRRDENWGLYLLCSILSVVIYLPLVAWLSLLIGIRIRHHSKAIFTALAVIVVWCVVPAFAVAMMLAIMHIGSRDVGSLLWVLSPATIIPLNEFFELDEIYESKAVAVLTNFALYGFLAYIFRVLSLRHLDRHLGRVSAM